MQTTISRTTAFSESGPATPRRWIGTTLVYVILLVAMVIAVFPILVMLLDSIKATPLITATPPVWIFTPTWEHYHNVLQIPSFPFTRYFLNSVIVAVVSTIVTLPIGFLAAYSMARYDTGGRNFDFWVLSLRMLPPAALLIPMYVFFNTFHLIDSVWALIIIYMTFNIPLCIWVL